MIEQRRDASPRRGNDLFANRDITLPGRTIVRCREGTRLAVVQRDPLGDGKFTVVRIVDGPPGTSNFYIANADLRKSPDGKV